MYNLWYKNVRTTLNYFTMAVLRGYWDIAAFLAAQLFSRSQLHNVDLYKSRKNDDMY